MILNELSYLPFSNDGGALLFHLLSKLHDRISVVITTNLNSGPMVERVLRYPQGTSAKMTTALLDRLTHRCYIIETGNESCRFRQSSDEAKARNKLVRRLNAAEKQRKSFCTRRNRFKNPARKRITRLPIAIRFRYTYPHPMTPKTGFAPWSNFNRYD